MYIRTQEAAERARLLEQLPIFSGESVNLSSGTSAIGTIQV
jgi:hypothetical protein